MVYLHIQPRATLYKEEVLATKVVAEQGKKPKINVSLDMKGKGR